MKKNFDILKKNKILYFYDFISSYNMWFYF